jgi:CheY-like chemotaxis protein
MSFRILLVEDDRASRQGLSALLTGAGYSVAETGSMVDAMEIIQQDPPDLIITDVRLAEFNGLYLAAVNPLRIPVVIVTGYPDPGLEQEARNLGADFLLKPIRPSRLLTIVEQRLPLTSDGEGFALARRWPRRRPTMDLPAQVDDTQVRVLDVSYGGMRLVGTRDANVLAKEAFCITFPTAALSVPVRVVWQSEGRTDRLCGATVPEEWQPPWRQLVDAVS